jgi:hypothetical protein
MSEKSSENKETSPPPAPIPAESEKVSPILDESAYKDQCKVEFMKRITPENLGKMMLSLARQGANGDVKAATLVLEYMFGPSDSNTVSQTMKLYKLTPEQESQV